MKILVNVTNLGFGGATQVADSFCKMLYRYPDINFIVAYNKGLNATAEAIKEYTNVKLVAYSFRNTWKSRIFARDAFLDNLVKSEHIDLVFSMFAPTWWTPKCPHFCGFALANLVMPESPYYSRMSRTQLLPQKIHNAIMTFFFWRCSRIYYTENQMISERLKKLLHINAVYTITNYYNQVFDNPNPQTYKKLPEFNGHSFLTITNPHPHKNLPIAIDITRYLKSNYPDFKFRFVFTITEEKFPPIPDELKENFLLCGPVSINECPSLYEQCDVAFQPTLLECFTATYPEAMKMQCPIVTTNLAFAQGLCGDAAEYYSAIDSSSAADALYRVSTNNNLRKRLIENGTKQLKHFDNYEMRADKIVGICKSLA